MKKSLLIGALEELDEMIPQEVNEDDNLDTMMLAIMEEVSDIKEDIDEIDDMGSTLNEVDASVERLEGIVAAIGKYGISTSMMFAVDPNKELVNAGICPAYEQLSDIPVHDENAQLAVNGITMALEGIFDKIKSFFKHIGLKLKDISIKQEKASAQYLGVLQMIQAKLKDIHSVNENNLAEHSIRAFTKDQFTHVLKADRALFDIVKSTAFAQSVTELENILKQKSPNFEKLRESVDKAHKVFKTLENNRDITAVFGIRLIYENNRIVRIERTKISVIDERTEFKNLGWKSGEVITAVEQAIKLLKENVDLYRRIRALAEVHYVFAEEVYYVINNDTKVSDEERHSFHYGFEQTDKILRIARYIMMHSIDGLMNIASSASQLGKAVIRHSSN